MDPAIGWFQPEQRGPALSVWTEIWNANHRLDNLDLNSKPDSKSCEPPTINNNNSLMCDERKASVKKNDSNSTVENLYNSNRMKRKENKASTHALSRNDELIIKYGGTPWRTREYYSPGLLGYVSDKLFPFVFNRADKHFGYVSPL